MSRIKRYESIRNTLMLELFNGNFKVGDLFSTDRELCLRFQAARNTVRHAVAQLVSAGYLTRCRHVGICVGEKYISRKIAHPVAKILLILPSWSYVNGNKYETLLLPLLNSGEGLSQPYHLELVSMEEFEQPAYRLSGAWTIVMAVDPQELCRKKLRRHMDSGGRVLVLYSEKKLPGCCEFTAENMCRNAVRHFYELGHRNIGMLCHFAGHLVNWQWMVSFVKAMNEFSLPILPGALCDGYLLQEYQGEGFDRVTAWICVNRRNLNNFLEYSRKKDLKIPDDVSVLCTDEAEDLSLGIGNLNWDVRQLALLIDQQVVNYTPGSFPLVYEVDPRKSTAPPRSFRKSF